MSARRVVAALAAVVLAAVVFAGAGGGSSAAEPAEPAKPRPTLEEVTGFGNNAGQLRMFRYVPAGLEAGRPLVVALHGCTQSAATDDDEPGWVEVAERERYALLLPQQEASNNANSCFNWFEGGDTSRGAGEAQSIKEMIDRMHDDLGTDPQRVYIAGLSAGGAMSAAMLAAYPEVFDGGAVVAGVPYGCARSVIGAFACMSPGVDRSAAQWGEQVRGASDHEGPWPRVSIWHGTADYTVNVRNATELMEQWTDVHGADQNPDVTDTVDGHPHAAYRDDSGAVVVETHEITGMAHGQPVAPGTAPSECGTAAPYILDVDSCAAYRISDFWGLVGGP